MPNSLPEDPQRTLRTFVDEDEFLSKWSQLIGNLGQEPEAKRFDDAIRGWEEVLQTLADLGPPVKDAPGVFGWPIQIGRYKFRIFYSFDDARVVRLGMMQIVSGVFGEGFDEDDEK